MKKSIDFRSMLLLCACAVVLTGCTGSKHAVEVAAVKSVRALTTNEEVYHVNLDYQGYVTPKETKKLSFATNGKVQAIYVEPGQWVQSGDVLVKLDTSTLETTIVNEEIKQQNLKATYESNILAAQLNCERQRVTKENLTILYNSGDISKQDYDSAVFAYNTASNDLNLLQKKRDNDLLLQQSAIDNYKKQVSDSTLTAPSDGYIMTVSVKPDEMISFGSPAVSMQSEARVINIGVSVEDFQRINTGMIVDITAGDRKLDGKVSRVELAPDSSAHTYMVEILPAEADMPVGTLVEVAIPLETKRGVFVPFSALVSSNGVNYIYTLRESEQNGYKLVVKNEIKIAGTVSEGRVLTTDMEPGQQVISEGVKNIKENDIVVVAE